MGISTAAVDGCVVEKVGEAVVFLLGERVVFVIVAAAAIVGETHPDGSDGLGHVHDVVDAVFLGDASAFPIDGVVAEEAGGEFLLEGGIGNEVAGDLPDGEVIVGEVFVEGLDDPVAPGPHGPLVVALEAIGVGVASSFEPGPCHSFAEGGVGEEAVDEIWPGVWGGVGEELVDLLKRG